MARAVYAVGMEILIIAGVALAAIAVLFKVSKKTAPSATQQPPPDGQPVAQAGEVEPTKSVLSEALELLETDDALGGERLLAEQIHAIEAEQGAETFEFAEAQAQLGQYLVAAGDVGRAEACLELAMGVEPTSEDQRAERIRFQLRLGEVQARLGRLEEAEKTLRENLALRREVFGAGSIAEALALESLTVVLMRAGSVEQALESVESAVASLLKAGHERLPEAFALRAFVIKSSSGVEAQAFADLGGLDAAQLEAVAVAVIYRARLGDPQLGFAVLAELEGVIREALGHGSHQRIAVLSEIANLTGAIGAHTQRVQALEMMVALLDDMDADAKAFEAVLASAGAYADAGVDAAVEAAFEDAEGRAEALGASARLVAARAHGEWLAEQAEWEGAIEAFERAESIAEAGVPELLAETRATLGLTLMHAEQDARSVLEAAAEALPEEHPLALVVAEHLTAIEAGTGCRCGEADAALSEALHVLIEARAPEGLLAGVEAQIDRDGGLRLSVSLEREPDEAETAALEAAIQAATQEYQSASAAQISGAN